MGSDFSTYILDNDDSTIQFFIKDALITAARALSCIDLSDAAALSTFDYLAEQASAQSRNGLLIALDEDISITTPVAALFLANILYGWDPDVIASYNQFEKTLWILWKAQDQQDNDSKLLEPLLYAIGDLAKLSKQTPVTPDWLIQAADSFQSLALVLERVERLDIALACAVTASNFASVGNLSKAEELADLALSLARRCASDEVVSGLIFRRAHLLAQIASQDPARRVDAFDAFESALSYPPSGDGAPNELIKVLESWIREEEYLGVFAPFLLLAQPPEKQAEFPVEISGIAAALNPIWKGEVSDWLSHISYIRALLIEVANARLSLLYQPSDKNARAIWSTWSLKHGQLLNAIPHAKSILKEEFLHDILLELSHEVTHVYSMFGFIGVTLAAMRWALMEAELDVWVRIYYAVGENPPENFYEKMTPAPLEEADMIALLFAERTVDIERKIQILENTWAPWFEGVAIFGELASDPEMDQEVESPVAAVIFNLWDRNIINIAQESNLTLGEAAAQDRAKADALYAEAIRIRGKDRLRTYLTRNHRKYLAGYLAVRSVIAVWRATLGKPLKGDQAFRLLLHAHTLRRV